MRLLKEVSNGMSDHSVDLLVIGSGASGANIAYEAAQRGLVVALLDAGDIGCSTSCRSTKLLHGGVRYLELAFKTLDISQLRLVREALIERSHWLEEAPFLAHQMELVLPSQGRLAQAYYRIGLGLYDALSGAKSIGRSRSLSMEEVKELLPSLKESIGGGVAYSDGQFNDARLNLLIALTAESAGTTLRTQCRVVELEKNTDGRLSGAISEDRYGNRERWIAKAIVNATGIHSDNLRQKADPNTSKRILTSRGVHLVLKDNLCPKGIGLLIPSTEDGRVLFVLPFFGRTQIGTTDTPCKHNSANTPSKEEKGYLINHLQHSFPSIQDPIVTSAWAGGRPLIKDEKMTTNSSRVVREHEIEILPCGLISAMGGKWTTCRSIAFDTMRAIEKVIGHPLPKRKKIPLIGTSQSPKETIKLLSTQRERLRRVLPKTELLEKQIDHLQANYGLEALRKVSHTRKNDLEPLSEVIPFCKVEVQKFIHEEHASTTTDILARRCRLAMVDNSEAQRLVPLIQDELMQAGFQPGALNLEQ